MKRLFKLMGCLLIAFSCITFNSCSKEDNEAADTSKPSKPSEPGDISSESIDQRLVGTWYDNSHSSYDCGVRFNANSTCVFGEWSKGQSERFNSTTEKASHWTTDGNKLNISYKFEDGDTDSETYIYNISSDGKTLTLNGGEFDGTYIKQ